MYDLSENGIYSICVSNLSYEEKINLLQKERECASAAIGLIDNAMNNLENGNYLEDIIKRKDELAKNIKIAKIFVGTGIGLGITSLATLNPLLNHIEEIHGLDNYPFLYIILVSSSIGFFIGGISNLRNFNKEYNSFCENLEDYQRRLK